MLVGMSRDRGLHLDLGLGWRLHSSIKKHDSIPRRQKGTQGNIPRRRQRENTVISGSMTQTRRRQSHSRIRMPHLDNAWAVSYGSLRTRKKSKWNEFKTSDNTEQRRRRKSMDLKTRVWITFVSGQTEEARRHVHT